MFICEEYKVSFQTAERNLCAKKYKFKISEILSSVICLMLSSRQFYNAHEPNFIECLNGDETKSNEEFDYSKRKPAIQNSLRKFNNGFENNNEAKQGPTKSHVSRFHQLNTTEWCMKQIWHSNNIFTILF